MGIGKLSSVDAWQKEVMAMEWEGYGEDEYQQLASLPPGFRFDPSDDVLVSFYLRRKANGRGIPPDLEAAIPVLDLYGPEAKPPWLLHPAASPSGTSPSLPHCIAPRDATDWFYCFTRTTARGSGSCRTTEAGTWVTSGGHKKVKADGGDTHGYKNTLAFKTVGVAGQGAEWVSSNWVMHEFKLDHDRKAVMKRNDDDGPSEQLVLCRIRCTRLMMGRGAELLLPEEVGRQKKRQRMCTGAAPCQPIMTAGFCALEPPRCLAQFIDGGGGGELIPSNPQVPYTSSRVDTDVGAGPLAWVPELASGAAWSMPPQNNAADVLTDPPPQIASPGGFPDQETQGAIAPPPWGCITGFGDSASYICFQDDPFWRAVMHELPDLCEAETWSNSEDWGCLSVELDRDGRCRDGGDGRAFSVDSSEAAGGLFQQRFQLGHGSGNLAGQVSAGGAANPAATTGAAGWGWPPDTSKGVAGAFTQGFLGHNIGSGSFVEQVVGCGTATPVGTMPAAGCRWPGLSGMPTPKMPWE